ncbi:hypothetical protein Tbd_0214 [Thiobacillus denitrificans ATCC 25259]|uniref:Uncharacterized protein n=1 Tax=Thiobacillus denitrificans (strain ATCC 25259 / T1) TaxID=292415 RepID=Q3SM82_THIDA|nr:hypothetical protein Tbd_0214 [Thiobacillus denitrificans ATCC 25259]
MVQPGRGDVADPRDEVRLDVPLELPEDAVERREQRRVAAVVGKTEGFAAGERQACHKRSGRRDDRVGSVDGRLRKIAVVGDAGVVADDAEVEAHARAGMAGEGRGRARRLTQQMIEAAFDEACSDQTL